MWQIRVCGCNRTSVLHHPVFPLNVLNLGHDVVGENGKFVSHVVRRVKNDACRQCSLNIKISLLARLLIQMKFLFLEM